jgi:protein involved in polysaccharide export with SLBB domain
MDKLADSVAGQHDCDTYEGSERQARLARDRDGIDLDPRIPRRHCGHRETLMFSRALGSFLVVSSLFAYAGKAVAQTIPSPAQAQQMLRSDPSLIGRLQQMMQSSGLTPDQVRARLRAQGYPESLLDQYLPGGQADSTTLPGDDVFAAVRALGIGDTTAVDSLSLLARGRRRVQARADSAFLDTLQRALRNDTTATAIRAVLRSREFQRDLADSGFKVFGLDMFSADTKQFDANAAGGADPNYRFGPGDKLVLFLTGDLDKSYPLTVTREGFVVIPDVGTVNVAGLTRSQLEDALYTRLGRVYSGIRRGPGATTQFYIDVSQIGTNQVFVNGDVQHPSSYRVSRAGTVMTALYMAGGPTGNGSMRNVQVNRGGETVATLDVYDYALHGNSGNDIRLENGDNIFVPPRGPQVRVAGNVLRPATYEIKPNETIADVIRMAGGFTETADVRTLQIERILPPAERTTAGSDRRIVTVESELFGSTQVRGGDVIRVREVARRVASRVTMRGNVWTPGMVGFTPGMTLYDAFRRSGGLKPDSYLGQVLISRLQPDSSRTMLRTAMYDTTGRPVNNIRLNDGDEVTVFSMTEFRPQRYITVNGAVKKPGQIPYRDGMTLHDAVLLSGGLLEGASLTDAEIDRLPENRAAGVTAVATTVTLDSSYLGDRAVSNRYIGAPGSAALADAAPPVYLQPYDAVLIKRQPEWQLQQTVSVQGEVRYPGDYSLLRKNERLSDIIARAGGLTGTGYADGIVFIRRHNPTGHVGDAVGRIGVDLPAVLRDPNHQDNLQLLDGDSIFIPRYAPVVMVRGSVNSPVGVPYVPGADIDYYVRSAGGESMKGDAGHAYVSQPNGTVDSKHRHFLGWTSQPRPLPGSTVFVPDKDPNDKRDWVALMTGIASILGSLVAIAAILKH